MARLLWNIFFLALTLSLLAACVGGTPGAPGKGRVGSVPLESGSTADPTATPQATRAALGQLRSDSPADGETAPASTETIRPTAEPQEAAQPVKIDPAFAGRACFGTAAGGVACLTPDGAWVHFTEDNSSLGGDIVTDMALCPDGRILMAHYSGVSAFDGSGWREYDDGWGAGSPEAIACDAAGSIWVAHFGGVSIHDGRTWTTHGAKNFESSAEPSGLVRDIAIGHNGVVWVVTPNTIARFDGQTWRYDEEGAGLDDLYFFDSLTVAPDGRVWAGAGAGLLASNDGAWELIENYGYAILEDVAVDPEGRVWVGAFSDGVFQYDGGGWAAFGREVLSSERINKVQIDNAGRVWVATDWGLNVFDGAAWHAYHMDNSGLPDNEIRSMVIDGLGPPLPEKTLSDHGVLLGRLSIDGRPLGGAPVELCVESVPTFFSGLTPCAGQPWVLSATSDPEGRFRFEDVPTGYYIITAETPTGWATLTNDFGIGSERVLVRAGEDTDVGELILENEE